jgi:hypothetical protein
MGSTTCCPVAVRLARPRLRLTTVMMKKERAMMTNKMVAQVSGLTRLLVTPMMMSTV